MKLFFSILFVFISIFSFSQAGDCPGYCLQTTGTFTATAGTINELNVTNRGCLTANEASSSFWFQICFSSSGQFQFYIDPSGNRNDFDWAIWNTTTCPPSGAPIRCSYAAVGNGGPCATCDWTGLGTNPNTNILATDVSETATGDGWLAPIIVSSGQCLTININNFKNGSSVFTIDLTGTTATITTPSTCAVLPIELLNFKIENKIDHNFLTWSTSSERNNDYFTIERSIDVNNWEVIGFVGGSGNTNEITYYSFLDWTMTDNFNYYRLKQTDYDGTSKYFTPIVIDNTQKQNIKLIKVYNLLGVEVDKESKGCLIYLYSNDERKRIVKN